MPSGADAGDTVHVDADVVVIFDRGPAGVDADADPHVAAPGPRVRLVALLDREGGVDRILGIAERQEELVAATIDLVTAVLFGCASNEPPMIGDHSHISVAELADEAGRILDVREEERHRARGQHGRGAG